jgi:hypothetical protein
MSFFDDASLVMIPSGYKDQKVYSVKPTDGTGDLTFSRASSATRVQSDGLIEKVRTNLVLQSEAFNTTWAVNGIVVTANSAANPLTGTTTADTITADAANNFHLITQSITYSANENTVSIYVKANGYSWFLIDPSITNAFGYFNVTTGAVGTKGSACTTSISNVGGGWYRCSVTFTPSAGAAICNFSIRDADNGGAFLGDGVSGFFIFGAQAETGVATDYIATTTAAVSVGPVSGLPRLDYLGSTCPRLLLEPQRTNLAQYSEQFNNAYWTKSNLTITANQLASPDGSTNADLVTLAAGTSAKQFYSTAFTAITTAYSYSIFAKKGTHNFIQLLEGPTLTINFDLNLGTFNSVSGASGKMENYGNGWYRCTMFGTGAVTPVTIVNLIAVDSLNAVRGQATSSTGTFYVWGAQVEAGAYATSYIPTLGASVTRVADVASKTGISSLIGQTEGTLFAEFVAVKNSAFSDIASLGSNGTSLVELQFNGGTNILSGIYYAGASLASINTISALTIGQTYKVAFAYKTNDFVMYLNGVQQGVDTSGTIVAGMAELSLNGYGGGINNSENAIIKQALVFKTRLTNAQLAELTA